VFELNEAFAAQALACQRELGIDNAKLNVNGGDCDRSPAWLQRRPPGHDADPPDGSHPRLAGIASLCVGVGQGLATVFERE
jgi:acetyl-CoA acetyltransferase